MDNKRVQNAVLECNLKNDRMVSVCFQGKPVNIMVIQVYAPTSNVEEAEVIQFYEDLQDLVQLTSRKDVLFIIADWNAKVGSQAIPSWVQFTSVAQSCLTLCEPISCNTPALPVHHQLPEATQTHVHWVGNAIQPSHPLSSPFTPALNHSQHQGLFKWVTSLHHVANVLEFQLQHQSFQWTTRTYLL